MKSFRHEKEKLLPILISRTVIFFFIMCLLTIFLYIAGTVQGFVDSTMLLLLRLYAVLGIFLAAASFSGLVLNLRRVFGNRKIRYLLRAGGYLLLALFGAATVLLVIFIITVLGGNIP